MYITIHEPNGVIQLASEEAYQDYIKDKIIIEAAGGLVFNEKNELLMIFRRGFWDLPKGKVDEGETLEQCAVREVQEETGLHNIKLGAFLTTTYHTYPLKGQTILKPSHWYKMVNWGNETLIPQTEEDITAIKFVSKEIAYTLLEEMYPTIKIVVEQYF
jgi:8-oxo-dGTP pyrophosphatase MutT (NUDIX family)